MARFFTQNLPESTDATWILRIRYVLAAEDQYLPEIGKYNAGQKLVFWSQFFLIGILLVTGIGLWQAGMEYLQLWTGFRPSIEQQRWAAVRNATAAGLPIAVWIVHVNAAIRVRCTISGMTRGTVTGGYGWRHHRKWLRRRSERRGRAS